MEKRMKYPMKCSRHINSAADSKCVKKIYHREYKYTIGKWNYLCSFHKNKKVLKYARFVAVLVLLVCYTIQKSGKGN